MENTHVLDFGKTNSAVLKNYITAREARALRDILVRGVKFENLASEEDAKKISNVSPEAINANEDLEISTVVVSLNGSTENILDRALALPANEFAELQKDIKAVVAGNDFLAQSKANV